MPGLRLGLTSRVWSFWRLLERGICLRTHEARECFLLPSEASALEMGRLISESRLGSQFLSHGERARVDRA
jgi:hypothetical protein